MTKREKVTRPSGVWQSPLRFCHQTSFYLQANGARWHVPPPGCWLEHYLHSTLLLGANPSALCQSQHPGQDLAGWGVHKAAGTVYTLFQQEFVGWCLHGNLTFPPDTIFGSGTKSRGTVRLQGQSSSCKAPAGQPERQLPSTAAFIFWLWTIQHLQSRSQAPQKAGCTCQCSSLENAPESNSTAHRAKGSRAPSLPQEG